ncbi:MAG: RagB/SusD family nutrient uptake outer membrane protein [Marinilabiliaceae bacterium]|nr:RagB/SusD family nutrient uptake outer membrane protein [Marinilabiliaceae bacterium]
MKRILYYIMFSVVILSCENFLDEEPTKSSAKKIETIGDLDKLMNALDYRYYAQPLYYSTDNNEMPLDIVAEVPTIFGPEPVQNYLFCKESNGASDACWNSRYETITTCNTVIDAIDNNSITGSSELKNDIKYEAHFIRAMEYFNLALIYCLHPSESNMDELGLPLRIHSDFEESLERATLQKTYDFIETELEQALKLDIPADRNWRGSKAAVRAFSARYWLYRGDYPKAKQYAQEALSLHSELVDYASAFTTYTDSYGTVYPMTNKYYWYTAQWLNFWKGQYMNRSIQNGWWKNIPSQELLDLYSPEDKRYEILMVEDYMKRFNVVNTPSIGYVMGGNFGEIINGPNTAEMYLILAECHARGGQIGDAMSNIEHVRIKRYDSESYEPLPLPANKKAAIEEVINERRREMPFSIRWYDIRRINVDPETDNITITRKFYPIEAGVPQTDQEVIEYKIEPNSRLYARPLHFSVVELSKNQTKQNTY